MSTEELNTVRLQLAQLTERYVELEDEVLELEERANDALDLAHTACKRMELLYSFIKVKYSTFEEAEFAEEMLREEWNNAEGANNE